MFQNIFAAVADTNAPVQVAASKAVELARANAGSALLYHAAYDSALGGRPFFDTARLARTREDYLKRQVNALDAIAEALASPQVAVDTEVEWERRPHEGIVRAAMREHADLVVAEPRYSATRRRRLAFSYTDWELVRTCPRPLLLARTAARYRSPKIVAAVDPIRGDDKLSRLDLRIVQVAGEFARMLDGTLKILHCSREPRATPGLTLSELERERRRPEALLKRFLREAELPAKALILRWGTPADVILQAVEKESVDILVLGSMTRGRLGNFVLGSTAEKLLHLAPCDMLVVKPIGFRTPVVAGSRVPNGTWARGKRLDTRDKDSNQGPE